MRYAVFFKVLYFCQWTLLNTEASPVNYICRTQVQTDVSVDTKHQTLHGVAFPISRDAFQALEKLSKKQLNYVQLVRDGASLDRGSSACWLMAWITLTFN